ncbi:MAG: sn-glycerol-3-phosphate import ATP-binding protein UgpC [Candidatus Abyssubacteria bacterium]
MAALRLENLTKVYQGGAAGVCGLTLEVFEGELMVLVGPSGSGKSTTLRLIAGLEEPSGGTIHIADTLANGVPPRDRDIAMVFQDYALYPHMNVEQNLGFGLKMRGFPKREVRSRVLESARMLGISDLLERKPKQLSGGQRQRVALGRALVRHPKAFLLDEPLSNVDASLRAQLRQEIKTLHERLGATMVYVTHDQAEAMALGQRIAVLNKGAIEQVGEPAELYRQPRTRFVAGFFGSPPMNFFEGEVRRAGASMIFECEGISCGVPGEGRGDFPRRVSLGFRPEDVRLGEAAGDGGLGGTAKIAAVETSGADTLIRLEAGRLAILARSLGLAEFRAGDTMQFNVPFSRLHLFDAETGVRMTW